MMEELITAIQKEKEKLEHEISILSKLNHVLIF